MRAIFFYDPKIQKRKNTPGFGISLHSAIMSKLWKHSPRILNMHKGLFSDVIPYPCLVYLLTLHDIISEALLKNNKL